MKPYARSRWSVVIAYAMAVSATMVMQLTYVPVTTTAAQRYGVSVDAIGWLAQLSSVLYVVLTLPSGLALDRWFRPVLLGGVVFTAVGGALRLVQDDFGWALAGQFVSAAAQPFVQNGVATLAARYLAEKDRSLGIAIGTASIFLGQVLAIGLGTGLSTSEHIPTLVGVGAAYGAVAAVACAFCLRRDGDYSTGPVQVWAGAKALRDVAGDGVVRAASALMFVAVGACMALMTWLEPLMLPAGVPSQASGLMLLAMIVAGIAGSLVLPVLAARRGAEFVLMLLASLVFAGGCLVLALIPGVATGIGVLSCIGALQLSCLPVIVGMIERRAPQSASTAVSLLWMAGNLGAAAISFGVQLLLGQPTFAFAALGVVMMVNVPWLLVMRRRWGQGRSVLPAGIATP